MKFQLFDQTIDSKFSQDFLDITDWVLEDIQKSGVQNGLVTIFTPHTTCAVFLNEKEYNLNQDMHDWLEKVVPQKGKYRHNKSSVDDRPNTHAHLRTLLLQSSVSIPIENGKCLIGSWQRVLFAELDGPRNGRKVMVHVMGE